VYLLGIGADAITNAVLGIGNARLFLENDRLDIKVHSLDGAKGRRGDAGSESECQDAHCCCECLTASDLPIFLIGACCCISTRTNTYSLAHSSSTRTSFHTQIYPEFVKITKNGSEMNAMRLNVIPERI
jgi:stage V sporulation protein SpoVS